MSIFNILSSGDFASTMRGLSDKAWGMADSVGRNMPSGLQDMAGRARDMAGTVGKKLPDGAGSVLGIGALAALVGSFMPKGVLKGAALMGAGAVAWNFYQKWSAQKNAGAESVEEADEESGLPTAQDPAALLMLRAMVYAARADGHIDESEKSRIAKLTSQFIPGRDGEALMASMMDEPLDLALLAGQIRSADQAEDLYRLSCLVLDIDHFMERGYLDALARALCIGTARQQELEAEAAEATRQLDAMA